MFDINQLLPGFLRFLRSCYDVFSNLITSQTSAQVPQPAQVQPLAPAPQPAQVQPLAPAPQPAQVKLDGQVVSSYQTRPSSRVNLVGSQVVKVDGDVRNNIGNENIISI
jgi:hypothetical protein